jgi:hypothetical protein
MSRLRGAEVKANTPWLVMFGTQTAIVRAGSEKAAFVAFRAAFSPDAGKLGRVVPPAREEVTIRRVRESDRGGIEDSGEPRFVALLAELR